jgi:hypothetical protein
MHSPSPSLTSILFNGNRKSRMSIIQVAPYRETGEYTTDVGTSSH